MVDEPALIQHTVEQFFHKPPSHQVHPDEAVALGAAVLAEESDPVELIDVLPLSIGVAGDYRNFERVLRRGLSLPFSVSFDVTTEVGDQDTIEVPIFQGERRDAALNEYLGLAVIAAWLGWSFDLVPLAATVAISVLAALNVLAVRLPTRSAVTVGIQQTIVGIIVIATTAVAIHLA